MYDATSASKTTHLLMRRTTVKGSPRWRTACNRLLLTPERALTDIRQVKCFQCRWRWRMQRKARRIARRARAALRGGL